MPSGKISQILQYLRGAAFPANGGDLTDGQLLEGFLSQREGIAFEALVRRHGAMVLSVCQRILRNPHDAEDAFQATFIVLIRKAAELTERQTVANWLYGVAYHVALKTRAAGIKRRAKERQVSVMPKPEARADAGWQDVRPLIDQELYRLPAHFREPVVLCDLEGKTRKEAAEQLGWPEGTVASRLARARAILARRLTRHSLALSTGSLAAALVQETASAGVPASLMAPTVQAALAVAAGETVPTSAPIAVVVAGVLRGMFLAKLKMAALMALAVAAFIGALSLPVYYALAEKTPGGLPVLGRTDEPVVVLDRAIQAGGGEVALSKLQMVTWRANLQFPGLGQTFVLGGYAKAFDRWFVYSTVPVLDTGSGKPLMTFKVLVVSDADDTFVGFQKIGGGDQRASLLFQTMKEKIRKGVLASGLKHDLYALRMAQVLTSLRDRAVKLSPADEITLDSRPATGITVVTKGHPDLQVFFDRETGLPVKCAMSVKEDDEQPAVAHELLLGDYQDIGGVRTFRKVTCKHDGQPLFEIDLVELSPQEKLDEGVSPETKNRYRD